VAVAAYRLPRQGETGCLPYQLASTQADSEDFSLRLSAIGIGPSRTGIFRERRSTNVDGAIGAILADLGMNPAAFNGIFMIARTPGLVNARYRRTSSRETNAADWSGQARLRRTAAEKYAPHVRFLEGAVRQRLDAFFRTLANNCYVQVHK